MILDTIANVINLEAMKRETIQDTIPESKEYLETFSGLLDAAPPIILGIGAFFIGAMILFVMTILIKKYKKNHQKFLKIKDGIFWNGIIRGL